jgi:glycosyltransferase involved in cell wall biosynthesis
MAQMATRTPAIAVIIPAYNEENSIQKVLADIPGNLVSEIIVVNNNSTDSTVEKAREFNVTVLDEPRQGYGFACLRGIEYLKAKARKLEIVVFLDADYSDFPAEMTNLVNPIIENDYDMVLGSRLSGNRERGAMPLQQLVGSWLAIAMISLFYSFQFTDLGPFRAVKFTKLLDLSMQDTTYGWTVEMQLKAMKQNYRICEVPVSYRARVGKSKISGTFKGTILAGYKIIRIILRYL